MGTARRWSAPAMAVLACLGGLAVTSCSHGAVARTAPVVTTQPLPATSAPASTTSSPGTGSEPDTYQVTPGDFRAVRLVMRARATAVLAHDRQAFLATVDRRQPVLVRQQETLYANLSALRLSHLSYAVADDAFPPDPVPGDEPTFRPEAYEHVQIARTFDGPVTNQVNDTFVKRDGAWLLGAETQPADEESFGAPTERPWFGGPIAAATDGPVTVLVDADSSDLAPALLRTVVADITADAGVLGVPPHAPVLVDATSNGLTHAMNSIQSDAAGAVTFALSTTDALDSRAVRLAGHVVKANPTYVQQLLDDGLTLKHELTHLLLFHYVSIVPVWVTEGIAQYVSAYPERDQSLLGDPTTLARVVRTAPGVPVSGNFDLDYRASYAIAESAVHFLVRTYGMPVFLDLLRTYDRDYERPNNDTITDQVLRKVDGIGLDQLDDAVEDDLRRSLH